MLEQAAKLFPYDRFIRTQPAYSIIEHLPPSEETVSSISSILRTDPFAADITYGLALHYYGIGHDFEANIAFAAFAKLAHNSRLSKQVSKGLSDGKISIERKALPQGSRY